MVSLSLDHVQWTVPALISLPKLQSLKFILCRVEGWENLCKSFNSLKNLSLRYVTSSGISAFPLPTRLETLEVRNCSDLNDDGPEWLDKHCESFPRLRKLMTDSISEETLISILENSRCLEEFGYWTSGRIKLTAYHMAAICRRAPPSLRSLSLYKGNYSEYDLENFIDHLPSSVTSLDLYRCRSLTPYLLSRLLELPALRELSLTGIQDLSAKVQELEKVAKTQKPARLEKFDWEFIPYFF